MAKNRKPTITIIYIINEIPKYFELSLKRVIYSGCEVFIIDKYHLTAFEDATYQINENLAIAHAHSDYICFLTDFDIIRTDFYDKVEKFLRKGHNIYEFNSLYSNGLRLSGINNENMLYRHSSINKIYKRQWVMENFIGFDLSWYMYNINHIFFNYITLAKNENLIYSIHDNICVNFIKDFSNENNYKVMYHRMLERLKKELLVNHQSKCMKNIIKIEDRYIRRLSFE